MATVGGDILFQDDFQDGRADGWRVTTGWTVQQDGNAYMMASSVAGGAAVTQGTAWRDYRFQAVARVTDGGVGLGYRVTRDGR